MLTYHYKLALRKYIILPYNMQCADNDMKQSK